jgi:regulator of sigma E protease
LIKILAFLFVLGVLVFVHELGHFLVARWNGVRVLTFSLGFGPKLLRRRIGETEYCISAIPLGGYVKMAGETPDEAGSGRPDEFLAKTKWQRFQILIAGPTMNILLAVAVMAGVLYQGVSVPLYEEWAPVVGTVEPGSPAALAGMKPGDRVLTVGGRPVATWKDFQFRVLPSADRRIDVQVARGNERLGLVMTPRAQGRFDFGDIGVGPDVHPQVRAVTPGSPAERAGLRAGDVVVAMNGRDTTDHPLVETIRKSANVPVTLTLKRPEGTRQVSVTPMLRDGVGMLGMQYDSIEVRTIQPTLLQAVTLSVKQNLEWSTLIFRTLGGLFTRETSPKQLMGPLGIAQLSGDAAELGWVALLGFMAMLSLNLGILNLLPIPILDGGHIFIMAIEGAARRDFSLAVKERMLVAGFVLLLMLMVTVIYNDLMRIEWVERLVPWR